VINATTRRLTPGNNPGKVNVRDVPIQGLNWHLGPQEFEAPRMSRESTYKDGRVVSPTYRPSLSAGDIPGNDTVPIL